MIRDPELVVLSAAGVSVALDVRGPSLPRVLHWGQEVDAARLVGDGSLLTEVAAANNALDEPLELPLLAGELDGWLGTQGVAGHRDGGDVFPRWTLTAPVGVSVGESGKSGESGGGRAGGRVVVAAADPEVGLAVGLVVELDRHGVLTVAVTLTATAEGTYDLSGVTALMPLPTEAREVLDLTGRWARERVPQRSALADGTHLRASRRGRTGHDATLLLSAGTPGFGFRTGEVWSAHVAWSGDHAHLVERLPEGAGVAAAVIGGGELLEPGEVRLAAGESYSAPLAVFVHSAQGLDGVSRRVHQRLRARPGHPRSPRPVVLNTWEAVYFDHDLGHLSELAQAAAAIGVERYVLDDGWFRHRRDDTAGLGDWWVDEGVWPGGLSPLFDRVRELGMQVGLWVEPEMVNPDSDLVRDHPGWVLNPRAPLSRQQQVLDLANPDAFAHLLARLDALVAENGVDFLKWDHNRDLHAPQPSVGARRPGDVASRRAGAHRQTVAVYALMDALRERHPYLEIESCSSGGARVDLGVLERTDRVWASDTNDPLERASIAWWTSLLLPPELLGAHVGPPLSHTTGRTASLSFATSVALFGHAGIEQDITALTPEQREELAGWIALHKELRPLLHTGDVVRGDPLGDGAQLHGVVSEDRREAVFAYEQLVASPRARPGRVRLPGLDPERTYRVRRRDTPRAALGPQTRAPAWAGAEAGDGVTVSGELLVRVGLSMPVLTPESSLVVHLTSAERAGG